ncbi:hypothetical protein M422DRAFT_67127 [Sphaerobolus stellatus SS14]|uniref:Uncharacterized protein n=1 Tax=Sphaerobolus stellatus (strain SS14) TaxID=990650 RepID=A0A0C9VT10_SPHS4|nr:hypothetical protein M422DRAFT_67127 [Sphaerobolus stellatus SS14]
MSHSHEHNKYPPITALRFFSPIRNTVGSMVVTSEDRYVEEMYKVGHGHAIADPEYLGPKLQLGDLVYSEINFGSLQRILNILKHPADESFNNWRSGFSTYSPFKIQRRDVTYTRLASPCSSSDNEVKPSGAHVGVEVPQANLSAKIHTSFAKSTQKGAVVIFNPDSLSAALKSFQELSRQWIPQNLQCICEWLEKLHIRTEKPTKTILGVHAGQAKSYTLDIDDCKLIVSVSHVRDYALAYWESRESTLDFELDTNVETTGAGATWGRWKSTELAFSRSGPESSNNAEVKDASEAMQYIANLAPESTDLYYDPFNCTIFVQFIEFHKTRHHLLRLDHPKDPVEDEHRKCWILYIYLGDIDLENPADGAENEGHSEGDAGSGKEDDQNVGDADGSGDENADGSGDENAEDAVDDVAGTEGTKGPEESSVWETNNEYKKAQLELTYCQASIMLRRYISLKANSDYSMVHSQQVIHLHQMAVDNNATCFATWLMSKDFVVSKITGTGDNEVTVGYLPQPPFTVDMENDLGSGFQADVSFGTVSTRDSPKSSPGISPSASGSAWLSLSELTMGGASKASGSS